MRIFLSMDILLTCFSSICFFVFVDEKNLWDSLTQIPKFGEGASFRNILCGVLTSYNNHQPVDVVEKIDRVLEQPT